MSESQLLIKCNERNDIESGGHFVVPIECETTPSVNEPGTTMDVSAASGVNANVPTPSMCQRFKDDPSGSCSKLSMDTSTTRVVKKRKRDGRKLRPAVQSCDDSDGGKPSHEGPQGRKKRQRRRKNRKYKPYAKLTWQEKSEQEDRETRRANRVRQQRFAKGQPVAPYNTTQFLIDDHNDLKDIDGPPPHNPPMYPRGPRPQRCRDSSFSLDSEEDFYYSSPEDEKEFLSKEFSNAYEDLHAEQLSAQPKSKLVQDILTLEKKVDVLEQDLNNYRSKSRTDNEEGASDERALLYKAEITKLSEENNRLRAENECLRRRCLGDEAELHCTISSSSVDSDSDSTASSSSCSSSCSSRDADQQPAMVIEPSPIPAEESSKPRDKEFSPSESNLEVPLVQSTSDP